MAVETPLAQTPREVADAKDTAILTTRSGKNSSPWLSCCKNEGVTPYYYVV
jgi:hypothetical protein